MWVYSPLADEYILPWGQEKFTIKKGVNEISKEIAQAYFVFALPDEVENVKENFEEAIKVALQRWGVVIGKKFPPDVKFDDQGRIMRGTTKSTIPPRSWLAQFKLEKTREELEYGLKQEQA